MTSTGLLIPEIDGLRFVAILSVFIYHLSGDVLRHAPPAYQLSVPQSSKVFSFTQKLDFGVPLFFVISGFILALPFALHYLRNKERVSLAKYYLRRVTRIEPPYVLALVLMFALKVLTGQRASFLSPHFTASLFYIHNLAFGGPSLINVVAWSLEIEIQFYLLAPVLAVVFGLELLCRRLLLSTACIAAAAFQAMLPPQHMVRLTLLGYLQYFLAGFLLADMYLTYAPSNRTKWDVVSIIGWPALAVLLGYPAVLPFIAPFLVGLLYIAALQGSWTKRIVSSPVLTTIGGMCYSIYLIHNYAIAMVGSLTQRVVVSDLFPVRLATQFLLVVPPVLLISAIYFRLIERPCMQLKFTLTAWGRRSGDSALGAAKTSVIFRSDTAAQ